jgi:hypothetical protein
VVWDDVEALPILRQPSGHNETSAARLDTPRIEASSPDSSGHSEVGAVIGLAVKMVFSLLR